MNTNTPTAETTVALVAHTTTQGNDMNTQNNTAAARRYKKSVIEMYTEAVESTIDSKKSATQLSASGNVFTGLNKSILNKAKAELGFKNNVWFTAKQMSDANLIMISEDDYGVILFSNKLKDIECSTKKEKIITYYRVFNRDSLEEIPV